MGSYSESELYEFDRFKIDGGKRLLWNGSEPLPLTPKAFDTLFYLVRNAGTTVTKDELMASIWPDTVVEENNLNKNISVLRQYLGEKRGEHRFIPTVPGKGYRFVASVVRLPANGAQESAGELPVGLLPQPVPSTEENEAGGAKKFLSWRLGIVVGASLILFAATFPLWKRSTSAKPESIRSIAVLPFNPISNQAENAALELGMADSLITQLSKSNDLSVRPLSETRRYATVDRDCAQIGRKLRVDAVLDGSVQVADSRLRVNARLIRSSDGKQLWASSFDDKMQDVFVVQDVISERVATVLNATLGKRSRKHYTENVDAYQLYILGRYTGLKLTPQDHFKAIEYFRKAIEKDPNYALAYAGLTSTYITFTLASDARPDTTLPEARAAAMTAAQLDSELPEAHVVLGRIALFYDWNWGDAERELQRAYDLDPNDTESLLYLAHFYSNLGRHEKAIEFGQKARKLDPLTINRNALAGQFLFYAGRYDDSISSLRETIEMNPNHWLPRMFIARAYIEKGMYREALAECDRGRELGSTSLELPALAAVSYAKLGETERARAMLSELQTMSRQRYVPPYLLALIHNALGDKDSALSMLEQGLAGRDVRMTFLKVDPKWNNLRSEPRFIALMKQMHFD